MLKLIMGSYTTQEITERGVRLAGLGNARAKNVFKDLEGNSINSLSGIELLSLCFKMRAPVSEMIEASKIQLLAVRKGKAGIMAVLNSFDAVGSEA